MMLTEDQIEDLIEWLDEERKKCFKLSDGLKKNKNYKGREADVLRGLAYGCIRAIKKIREVSS